MRMHYLIENPQEIQATLKITMSVKDWEELREQLATRWPSSRLSQAITAVLVDARRLIYPPEEKDGLK